MVRSLANVIFKKTWAKLVVLKEQKSKQEENTRLQKEEYHERKLGEMAMSATEQIQLQVDKSLEPKLEVLLAKKVRTSALKTKPSKKEQHYKFSTQSSNTREHFAKKETRRREHSDDTESILAKFAKRNVVEDPSFETEYKSGPASNRGYDTKPSGKGHYQPSGKGRYNKRGICKPVFEPYYDCYSIDVAQCTSLRIRSFRSGFITPQKV